MNIKFIMQRQYEKMTEAFPIRIATPDDLSIIVTHRRKMFEDMGETDTQALDRMDAVASEWLRERLNNGHYIGWFALNDAGDVIAGAGLWLQDWIPGVADQNMHGYVLNVYVERDYRRRGLARYLMQTVLDWCKTRNIKTVTLHASDEGRFVYEGLGFRFSNEMRLVLR